ncbi:inactive carboxylesterase 4 [Melanomma pulvis-pyrius CBS 109.77]|uniref:Carboxylic ester hydrolase n=1 Tax=Melanomma pulvis-pyrius CBS 109.77 TaxID=1314802 RepID=A0A6A6WQF8_9PLEO|nr:inactive carboxylesterase 4 [Melanomma pulvis-pyrius CBS 109.77]
MFKSALFKAVATYALLLVEVTAIPSDKVKYPVRLGSGSNLTVDLDYAIYQGTKNEATGLNVWKGIRYAAPPIGDLRWKAPKTPQTSRNVTPAVDFGPNCPQAYPAVPNAPFIPGNEDCLFLNVYAPPNSGSVKLPVLVYIHGGGYGFGDGKQDISELINANEKDFIAVSIQYRLGAFGFLSSSEIKANGVLNAGILDMAFALDWVQKHIGKFGGDSKRVTISGESAGGGAVMLLAIAKDGTLGTSLFSNGIAASPYLPAQYDYNHAIPTRYYYELAAEVGCGASGAVLECLRAKDSEILQQANNNISIAGAYGTWSFLPVTDYTFITKLPSVALNDKKVNGESILVGNNANEGALFVPPNITTLVDLRSWLRVAFPTFSLDDIQNVITAYPSVDSAVNASDAKFATNGYGQPTAVNVSQIATGQQQRAYNIYAEATFVCPSYWLNNAYAPQHSFHYQYSVPFGSHADDVSAYFGPSALNQSPSFSLAFRQIWGNFVTTSNPSLASEAPTKKWPGWMPGVDSRMISLNQTGGIPYEVATQFGVNVTQFKDPGLRNLFKVVDAYEWEGARGERCEFWKRIGGKLPI